MLAHPSELRPLSVEEYAAIQQFPQRWKLAGGTPQKYKQLGNAVPVGLGAAIGLALRNSMRRRKRIQLRAIGLIVCADPRRLHRLAARPQTVLNPERMRGVTGYHETRAWMSGRRRADVLKLVALEPPQPI